MVGQKNLLSKLNIYNIDTFPRTVLIAGEQGSGKHLIVDYIKNNIVKLPLLDITLTGRTKDYRNDIIDPLYLNPNPSIYILDFTKTRSNLMETGQSGVILKLFEEPPQNAFIIALVERKEDLLDTIRNRCIIFEMDKYSNDELSQFIDSDENKDLILKVLRTPGKIKTNNTTNLNQMLELCDKIIDKIQVASYANTLSLKDKFNFKDNYDKFDIEVFMDLLSYRMFSKFIETNNKNILEMYKLTGNHREKLLDKRFDKERLFILFITELWNLSRSFK